MFESDQRLRPGPFRACGEVV